MRRSVVTSAIILLLVIPSLSQVSDRKPTTKKEQAQAPAGKAGVAKAKPPAKGGPAPTVAEAEKFMADAEARLTDLAVKYSTADWVNQNFITDDTEKLSSYFNAELIGATTQLAEQANRFDQLKLPPTLARKFKLLKLSLPMPAPSNAAERKEIECSPETPPARTRTRRVGCAMGEV